MSEDTDVVQFREDNPQVVKGYENIFISSDLFMILMDSINPSNVNGGTTALHLAIIARDQDSFDKIMKNKYTTKDVVNVQTTDKGTSPLHLAAQWGDPQVIQALIDKGANINATDKAGNYPQVYAQSQEAKDLLSPKPDNANKEMTTRPEALKFKQENSSLFAGYDLLTAKLANAIKAQRDSTNGLTALHYAIEKRDKDTFEKIMANHKQTTTAAINAQTDEGISPLHLAAQLNEIEMVKALVSRGANLNAQDSAGMTPSNYVSEKDNAQLYKLLVEKGAEHGPAAKLTKAVASLAVDKTQNTGYFSRFLNYIRNFYRSWSQ